MRSSFVNVQDWKGYTALHYAIENYVDCVKDVAQCYNNEYNGDGYSIKYRKNCLYYEVTIMYI